jgi:transcriptional regulator with XRE-family HTH domain
LRYNQLTDSSSQIGRELLAARKAVQLSRAQAAALIGVDPQTIYRWERGERTPSAGHYLKAKSVYATAASGSGQMVPRGTSTAEFLAPLEVMITAFERDAARMGATDWELDHIAAALRGPHALRMLRTDAAGRSLSVAEQVEELGYQIDGLRVWLSRRIAARSLPPHVTTDEATSPRKVPVPHPTKGRGSTQRKTGS